ncbi:MAG: phytase [Anaerolineae bacterium]
MNLVTHLPHSMRRWINFCIVVAIGLVIVDSFDVGNTPVARADHEVDAGYRDFAYDDSCSANPTAEKSESKLWFNDGFWWGSLCNDVVADYHIYRLDPATQTWVDTRTLLDERAKSRADTMWDGTHLYVASHLIVKGGPPGDDPSWWGRLYRYSYDSGSKTYSLDDGFPVNVTRGRSETLTIAKDTTDTLWVTYIENQQVMVNHSTGDDRAWSTPFVLPVPDANNLTVDDISSIITFDGHIGVMWSNQNTNKMYFAAHADGAPDEAWQSGSIYTVSADDHINLKSVQADPAGGVFAVVKTSLTGGLEPRIVLLACTSGKCASSSEWETHTVSRGAEGQTRPLLLIDLEDRDLYVFTTTSEGGRAIYYKTTDMDDIQFPEGPGEPFIESAMDVKISNPTSTKQNLNSRTGLVVLASDSDTRYYLHNYLGLGTASPTATVIPTPTATHARTPTGTPTPTGQIAATVETDPVPHGGDAADDLAIWIHPTDPAQSTIIGTDKRGGLAVYDLTGHQLQYLPDGKMNNVDIRYNFPLGGESVALITAGNRTNNSIAIYKVDPTTRLLENVAAGIIQVGIDEAYGSCMYRSPITGRYYFIVNDTDGDVEQWELFANHSGKVDATRVRSFSVGSQTEGCVADDEFALLYVGEETVGIWKYGAEPGDETARTQVDQIGPGGHLTGEVEGLTIYHGSDGTGYLIASSQGSNEFVIYRREGNNEYMTTFEIAAGNGIDGVSGTDGIDVTNFPLGPAFPQGVFIAQDHDNTHPTANQNYKLVPWPPIANAVSPPLTIDTLWDPRQVGAGEIPGPMPTTPAPSATPMPSPTLEPAEGPVLTIPDQVPAWPGGSVKLPISLAANGNAISNLTFSVDYDNTWLTFDPTDTDGDSIPSAVTLNLPGSFNASVNFDEADTDGELDFLITDLFPPLSSLSDRIIASITLSVGSPPGTTEATVNFSRDPVASFEDPSGQRIPGTADGGSVLIIGPARYHLRLPLILR